MKEQQELLMYIVSVNFSVGGWTYMDDLVFSCIWASDALQYSGGEVTHSSAYNYRGNLLAARIAEMIGEDPGPYKEEAERIKLNGPFCREKIGGMEYSWYAYWIVKGH